MTRIASLDVIRGVAVLGILLMNVVSFGIGIPAYFNLDFDDSGSVLDRSVGVAGELLARARVLPRDRRVRMPPRLSHRSPPILLSFWSLSSVLGR